MKGLIRFQLNGQSATLDIDDSYEISRFSSAPRIEAVLVKNDELAPQGGGEPAITTTGAVLANAVFDATGARMLRLPMLPDRVRKAMGAKRTG